MTSKNQRQQEQADREARYAERDRIRRERGPTSQKDNRRRLFNSFDQLAARVARGERPFSSDTEEVPE